MYRFHDSGNPITVKDQNRLLEVKGMMKKDKTLRVALSGVLMLAVVAAGVTMYRSDGGIEEKEESQVQEQQTADNSALSEGQEEAMNSGAGAEAEDEMPETADVTADEAQAENTQALGGDNADVSGTPEASGTPETSPESQPSETPASEETAGSTAAEDGAADGTSDSAQDTAAPVQPSLNFSEDSTMLWPVSGEVLIDYSMNATIYFPTLDQYKYNSALVLGSAVGEPVQAAANGQVVSILENEETGTTLTMDLGNGYQAVYGQLKDLAVSEGQTVEAGAVIGYVSEPTKYYVREGANLYFAMTKDGAAIDPMIYIETVTE